MRTESLPSVAAVYAPAQNGSAKAVHEFGSPDSFWFTQIDVHSPSLTSTPDWITVWGAGGVGELQLVWRTTRSRASTGFPARVRVTPPHSCCPPCTSFSQRTTYTPSLGSAAMKPERR
jgi:hypothetical protein